MSFQVSLFINGLKDEFKSTLWLLKPTDLLSVQANVRILSGDVPVSRTPSNTSKPLRIWNRPTVPIARRRLSQEEIEERRMKGLCFGCNEPFDRNHKCSKRQVYSMIVESIEEEAGLVGDCAVDIGKSEGKEMYVTLHAMQGEVPCGSVQTMQVKGWFKKKSLNILVDSGSTHNFVDLVLVKGMNLLVETVSPIRVTVADGRSLICRSMLRQFGWEMQGETYVADFYIIPLGGCELILGVSWLARLGDITWNFHLSLMKFIWKGVEVVLVGDSQVRQRTVLQTTTVEKMQKI
ncbi:hypothetical protein MLD38_002817 [Melastoma candidum]|uniref:Uncharacterized protein n=1 Tax=Melastoma candidum TaxID=119954 RepID=A0ACB9S241_9MYRT|nr:hypothetical protein MLD38_002817 [Melastoma candidum]